jgi:hypothetical protein
VPLTVVRYRTSPTAPQAEIDVNSPEEAVLLLRQWQRRYPRDRGLLLDEQRQPIATCKPAWCAEVPHLAP